MFSSKILYLRIFKDVFVFYTFDFVFEEIYA